MLRRAGEIGDYAIQQCIQEAMKQNYESSRRYAEQEVVTRTKCFDEYYTRIKLLNEKRG